MPQPLKRILAAIMFTDIKGYTAMMQKDEQEAIRIRKRHREIFQETMSKYNGQILQYYGDGTLSILYSTVDAVLCGIEMQSRFLTDPEIPVRIGIHSGDIIYNNEEIIGDSVNVASRLEALAAPGSLLISEKVYQDIVNQHQIDAHFMGKVMFKNVTNPMPVYCITNSPLKIPSLHDLSKKGRIRPKTIAVMPFANISRSDNDDFFSDGITEEILNVLAKIDTLQVTSRTSSFAFKNKELNTREIGKSLNVEYILEGSIRTAGDRVRITAQLIQTQDDFHLWSERYDRNLEDIFSLQDEIANKIGEQLVDKLEIKTDIIRKRRKINTEAHNAYLKGRFYFNKWTPEFVRKSISHFEEAIKIDPEYAEAYAGIAGCYVFLGITGYDKEGFAKGLASADKAYSLNPENEDSILSKAMITSLFEKKKHEAGVLFTKALQINPDYATAHHYYAMHLGHIGSLNQAVIEYERAVQLDPLSSPINAEYGIALSSIGQHDKALIQINKAIELNKNFRTAWESKGWIYYMMKKYDKAVEAFEHYQNLTDSADKGLTGLAVSHAKIGNTDKARSMLNLMLERKLNNPDVTMDIDLSMVYLGLNEIDLAIDYLESGLSKRQGSLFVNTIPFFKVLDGNPKFELLKTKYLPKD